MGLLSQGSPLNWEETKKVANHIRQHGIIQFLNIYNKVKERQKDVLKWGDEVRNGVKRLWICNFGCSGGPLQTKGSTPLNLQLISFSYSSGNVCFSLLILQICC